MKKNLKYLISTIIIILIAGGFGIYSRLSKEEKPEDKKPKTEKVKAIVKVETVLAKKKDLIMEINTTGTAKAIKKVDIAPQVGGDVQRMNVHENSFVKKGEILFTIDDERYQLNLADAQNQLTTAKIEYGIRLKQDKIESKQENATLSEIKEARKELKKSFRTGEISKEEFDQKLLELDVQELFLANNRDKILQNASGLSAAFINYSKAKIDLGNTIVKAPFQGYIANQNLVDNDNVNAGETCMQLVDISTIKMEIPVLESEVGDLKEDRKVTIKFDAYPDKVFTGKIKHISPIVDEQTKTCKVIVHIKNEDLLIKPGMDGDVTIEGKIYKELLLVPKEAVITRDNRKLLFIVEDGKAKWVYIKTGLDNFEMVEIKDKLKVGQEVVITNNYTLAHDASVKVIKRNDY